MDIYLSSIPLQILSILLILTFSWISYRNPRFSAWLIPLILPFYLIKIYLPLPARVYRHTPLPTNLLEILLIIFLVINYRLIIKTENRLLKSNIGYLILFSVTSLAIISLFSSFVGVNLLPALGAAKSWFIVPIFFFLALNSLFDYKPINNNHQFINKQYKFITLRSTYQIYYLISFIFGGLFLSLTSLFFVWNKLYTYDNRLSGLFLSPNQLAMSLVPSFLALSIYFLYKSEISDTLQNFYSRFIQSLPPTFHFLNMSHNIFNKLISILFASFFLIEIVILYLTFSYGTWLGIFGAFIFFSIVHRIQHSHLLKCYTKPYTNTVITRPRPGDPEETNNLPTLLGSSLKPFSVILIIAFASFLLFFSQFSNPKLQHILNDDYYSSLHSRLMIWQSALKITTDYPIFGIGPSNFQQVYLAYASRFSEPYIEWAVPQPHNIFLAFSTQLGLFGLSDFILILCIIGYLFHNQTARQAKNSSPFQILAFSYFIYFIIHGLIDTPYFKNDLSLIFWIMLAGMI